MRAVCDICFHRCALEEGQKGMCGARANRGGRITALNYGMLTALALDPIEKKPFRRFRPGSMILSAGSFGCNLRCEFCQNHEISAPDSGRDAVFVSPEALAAKAVELIPAGNIGVAYTYNEPLVGFEYALDCAKLVRERGLVNALVTNGTIEEGPWRELLPYIDAANIDLKGFSDAWYKRLKGDLDSVKRSIEIAAGICHVEVTTLVIPGENDGAEEMRAMSEWLASIDPGIPLHITRFFPRHKMTDRPPTPVETLMRLADEAKKRLDHVYIGNI